MRGPDDVADAVDVLFFRILFVDRVAIDPESFNIRLFRRVDANLKQLQPVLVGIPGIELLARVRNKDIVFGGVLLDPSGDTMSIPMNSRQVDVVDVAEIQRHWKSGDEVFTGLRSWWYLLAILRSLVRPPITVEDRVIAAFVLELKSQLGEEQEAEYDVEYDWDIQQSPREDVGAKHPVD